MSAAAVKQILCPSNETDKHELRQVALPASSGTFRTTEDERIAACFMSLTNVPTTGERL